MADNLNVQNDPGQASGAGSSPLGSEPTNSPLEQSSVPQGAPPEQPMGQAAPPVESQNLGESSTPPNTDEFLNSILQQQPQAPATPDVSAPPVSPDAPPVAPGAAGPIPTEPAPPLNNPLEPQVPEPGPINNPLQPQENPMPEPPAPAPEPAPAPMPEPTPMEPPAPEMPAEPPVMNQPSGGLSDGVSLDGVQSAPTPAAPQPPADGSVSTNMFSQTPQASGGSGMKKLILIVLALIVLGGGYYAYTVFMGGSSTSNSATKSVTPGATKTSSSSTATNAKDSQRKTDLAVIKDALMNYYAGSNQYPVAAQLTMLNVAGNILEQQLIPNFLAKLPSDPDSTKAYGYKSDGMTFTLSAVLDNSSDPDAVLENGKAIYQLTSSSSSATGASASASSSIVVSTPSTFAPSAGTVDDAQTATATSNVPPTLNSNF